MVSLSLMLLLPAPVSAPTIEVKKPSPSADGPSAGRPRAPGAGIRPMTLPASLQIPAMSRLDPLGAPSEYPDDDPAGALKFAERGLVGDEGALAVLDRYDKPLPVREARRPGCRRVGHGHAHVRVDDRRPAFLVSAPGSRCASQRIWKPLHMPSNRQPRLGRGYQLAHHGVRTWRSHRSAGSRRRESRRGG